MGFWDSLNPVPAIVNGVKKSGEWISNVWESAKAGAAAAYNFPMPGGIAGWIASGGLITVGVLVGGLIAGAWNRDISTGIYSVACYTQLNAMGYNENNFISPSEVCSIPNCKSALGDQCQVQELKYSSSNQPPKPVNKPPNPVFQPKAPEPVQPIPIITPTPKPLPPLEPPIPKSNPPNILVQDRCDQFDESSMSTIFLEWQPGAPLTFYLKIPSGVPGLERNIVGDDQLWNYDAEIGGYKTDDCRYEGYAGRLYCRISLPSEYASSIQPLDINVDGCNTPIYTDQRTELPDLAGVKPSGGKSGGSSSGSSEGSGQYCSSNGTCPPGYYCDTMNMSCVPIPP